jgi:signal transduction histidine kinase
MVLENLINNADKYSPPDGAIEVSATTDEQAMLLIRVRDQGIGIADKDRENLFAPFYRSDNARQYASGMGLGLAVCKRIVEAHGGEIWIEHRPEGGTDFVFSLPRVR